MKKTLQMMLTSTKSNNAPVTFLWKSVHVYSIVLRWWHYLRHLCLDDVIKLLYSLYAFIALYFDILHLWRQHMCGKWILAHIWYAFGFAPKTGCDSIKHTKLITKTRAMIVLHLWHQHMYGKWILAHICYAFGFAPRTGCDRSGIKAMLTLGR